MPPLQSITPIDPAALALIGGIPDDHTTFRVTGEQSIELLVRRASAMHYAGTHRSYRLTGGLVIEAGYARPKGFKAWWSLQRRLKPGWTLEQARKLANETYLTALSHALLDADRADLMRRFDQLPPEQQTQIGEEATTDGQKLGLTTVYDEMDIPTIEAWHDWLTRRGVSRRTGLIYHTETE
jgi:hypothetical protein